MTIACNFHPPPPPILLLYIPWLAHAHGGVEGTKNIPFTPHYQYIAQMDERTSLRT